MLEFRHEYKHQLSEFDCILLRSRFNSVLFQDTHSVDGKYKIRSLYFDNIYDTALKEKIDGVNMREKFRIRSYNNELDYIMLEKKSKINGLCNKQSAPITVDEIEKILIGDTEFLEHSEYQLKQELYLKMKNGGLNPKTLVDYTREAFIYPAGNVRITLDYDIRTGLSSNDFLNPDAVTIPAGDKAIILEVKWDEFLPDFVRSIIQTSGMQSAAFSKYAACRIYG